MGKGQSTTTSSSSTAPTAQGQSIYDTILGQAANAAATPYQSYSGQLTAPINSQQTAGIAGINANAGFASPYITQAAGLATGAASPLTSSQINNYLSPYTQDVVDATQAQFNNQNAQQQAALTGNTIAQGALGGNRQGVAQGVLAGQQQLAQAPVIANLYNQGYNQAVQTAAQQYQQNPLAAASSIANFGISGQNAALTGANAQVGAGTLQQQTQQAQDTAAYNQFLQQQAYPFQTAQYYANIAGPIAGALGTTSSGTTTAPAPNQTAQYLGLGLSGLSLLSDERAKENIERVGKADNGQIIYKFNYKGSPTTHIGFLAQEVEKRHPEAVSNIAGLKAVDYDLATRARGGLVRKDGGGGIGSTPYAGVIGYVPVTQSLGVHMANAAGFPQVAQTPQAQSPNLSGIAGLKSSSGSGLLSGPAYGGGNIFTDSYGGSSSNPLPGLDASDYGEGFAGGGGVAGFRGYADGGAPDDPVGDDNRLAGLQMLRDQMAPAVTPSPLDSASWPYGPNDAPVNPDEPYRMPDQAAVEQWRQDNPVTTPVVAKSTDDDEAIPAAAQPTAGVAGLVRPTAPPVQPFARDDAQAGFARAPSGNDQSSFGLGLLSPNMQHALLATGLGMLASRSPFLGNAIGEGGLAGLNAYGADQAADLKARQDEIKQQQDNRRIEMESQRLQMAAQQAMREAAAAPITADGRINPVYLDLKKREADIAQKDNWAPIGSVVAADGTSHPLVMNRADHTAIDLVTQKPPLATDRIQGIPGKGPDPAVIQHNVDAIVSGHQPPTLTGLYGQSAAIRAGLEEKGFDLAKAQLEWKQAEKQIASLNGPQMTRFVGLAHSVDSTIDEVRELSKEMNLSGIPALNSVELAAYIKANGNSVNGQLATRYSTAVNTLKEEFANLANGGYAPTEPAWKLADQQINGNYGVKQLGASLDEVQRLIRYRVNAIPGLSSAGPGSANRYTGQSGQQPSAATASAPSVPQRPANVPFGSAYSASRNQWRTPDGTILNADGRRP